MPDKLAHRAAQRVQPEHAAAAIAALKADGFRVWEPPSEADPQLAYLACIGVVEYVMSEGSDMLALGVPRLLTKFEIKTHSAVLVESSKLFASRDAKEPRHILSVLHGKDDAWLRILFVLARNDYNKFKDIGLPTAVDILRRMTAPTPTIIFAFLFEGSRIGNSYGGRFPIQCVPAFLPLEGRLMILRRLQHLWLTLFFGDPLPQHKLGVWTLLAPLVPLCFVTFLLLLLSSFSFGLTDSVRALGLPPRTCPRRHFPVG